MLCNWIPRAIKSSFAQLERHSNVVWLLWALVAIVPCSIDLRFGRCGLAPELFASSAAKTLIVQVVEVSTSYEASGWHTIRIIVISVNERMPIIIMDGNNSTSFIQRENLHSAVFLRCWNPYRSSAQVSTDILMKWLATVNSMRLERTWEECLWDFMVASFAKKSFNILENETLKICVTFGYLPLFDAL